MTNLPNFLATLGRTLEIISDEMDRSQAIPADADWLDSLASDGIKYDQSKRADTALLSLKGKPTKKYAHASIYRHTSGSYEWLVYFL